MYYIYKIINLVDNKIYIGKTIHSIENRFKAHLANAKKGCDSHLYNAMRMYGNNKFIVEELDNTDDLDHLNELEKYWISYYNSTNQDIGYNMTNGGDGGNTFEYLSEEKKENRLNKISQTNKNKDEITKREEHERRSKASREAQKLLYENGYININRGTKWYNNGFINKMAREKPEGFEEGRIKTDVLNNGIKKMNADREIWFNNGIEEIKCKECNKPDGFIKGKLKKKRIYTNLSQATKDKISESVSKLWEDDKYRQNMIDKHKEYRVNDETKLKLSIKNKWLKVIHKGDNEKRVHTDEINIYLNDGWEIGQSEKHKLNNGKTHRKQK